MGLLPSLFLFQLEVLNSPIQLLQLSHFRQLKIAGVPSQHTMLVIFWFYIWLHTTSDRPLTQALMDPDRAIFCVTALLGLIFLDHYHLLHMVLLPFLHHHPRHHHCLRLLCFLLHLLHCSIHSLLDNQFVKIFIFVLELKLCFLFPKFSHSSSFLFFSAFSLSSFSNVCNFSKYPLSVMTLAVQFIFLLFTSGFSTFPFILSSTSSSKLLFELHGVCDVCDEEAIGIDVDIGLWAHVGIHSWPGISTVGFGPKISQ